MTTTNSLYLNWFGYRINVSTMNEDAGEPLLLVNGLGCGADMWAPFVAAAFPNRHVIGFDAPGTGKSSTPVFPVTVPALALLAVAVLDACGADWADVLGFSYGGAVAQQLAHDYPDRVRRLVLAATTCGLGGVPGTAGAMAAVATTLRFYSPAYFDRMAPALFGGVTGRDARARTEALEASYRTPPCAYGYAMQLAGAAGWSSLPFLGRIPHETLVICGDDDPLVPAANAELLAGLIPRARLDIVERAGHLFLWDDAPNLAPRIARFVNGPTVVYTNEA
jgi:poly(3-hydroxyalkanoate) depolymerase